MSERSIMDLYEMLGVTPKSSISDIRRAYLNMARFCHPDKGGYHMDMLALKRAYDHICKEIHMVSLEAKKGSYEEREAMYTQEAPTTLPSFSVLEKEIHECILDPELVFYIKNRIQTTFPDDMFILDAVLRRLYAFAEGAQAQAQAPAIMRDVIVKELDSILDSITSIKTGESMPASIPGGYGDLLDNEVREDVPELPELPEPPRISFGVQELVVYDANSEPTAATLSVHRNQIQPAEIPLPRELEDYSVGSSLCDYRIAFTDTTSSSQKLQDMYEQTDIFSRTHESLLQQRIQLDTVLSAAPVPTRVIGLRSTFENNYSGIF